MYLARYTTRNEKVKNQDAVHPMQTIYTILVDYYRITVTDLDQWLQFYS
jgi:hypothetical protein